MFFFRWNVCSELFYSNICDVNGTEINISKENRKVFVHIKFTFGLFTRRVCSRRYFWNISDVNGKEKITIKCFCFNSIHSISFFYTSNQLSFRLKNWNNSSLLLDYIFFCFFVFEQFNIIKGRKNSKEKTTKWWNIIFLETMYPFKFLSTWKKREKIEKKEKKRHNSDDI